MCHPESDAGRIEAIDVTATLGQGGEIELVYRVTGAVETLKIAGPAIPDRVDGYGKIRVLNFLWDIPKINPISSIILRPRANGRHINFQAIVQEWRNWKHVRQSLAQRKAAMFLPFP